MAGSSGSKTKGGGGISLEDLLEELESLHDSEDNKKAMHQSVRVYEAVQSKFRVRSSAKIDATDCVRDSDNDGRSYSSHVEAGVGALSQAEQAPQQASRTQQECATPCQDLAAAITSGGFCMDLGNALAFITDGGGFVVPLPSHLLKFPLAQENITCSVVQRGWTLTTEL